MATSTQSLSSSKVVLPPENVQAIANLQPPSLWKYFATVSSIPRPSKHEQAIVTYIQDFADQRDWLRHRQDAYGNLVVFHPGCGIGKQAPPVIVQAHLDMVTEKNSDSKHKFETDPILLRCFTEGSQHWMGAQGTTLGADNGIGVATALALLEVSPDDNSYDMPPLEALFTVDEETGLTGASHLDARALGLTGHTLLNLDTEEWGTLYVGCAGGGESVITLRLSRGEAPRTTTTVSSFLVELRVDGLLGGHSGMDIHQGRANAILLCAAAAQAALQLEGVRLISITGGDKHNAIPREARAILLLTSEDTRAAVQKLLETHTQAAREEYGTLEKNLNMVLMNYNNESEPESCPRPLEQDSAFRLLSLLLALPHGPLKFSHTIPDLVETSNNVASLTINDKDTATILCSTRSSIGSALEAARTKLTAVATLAGASIQKSPPYPGWNPNLESELLQLTKRLLAARLDDGDNVGVKAVHAGLECGILMEKIGGKVDALSLGPTIHGAHSPDERVHIDTVAPFFGLVQDILTELAQKRE